MQPLSRNLKGCHAAGQEALDALWSALPEQPSVCWYPSAGNCFRDLLIWNHYSALAEAPEPDLYIHTDYGRPGRIPEDYDDGRTRITPLARYRLVVSSAINYQVEPAYASHAGRSAEYPIVELLHVRAESGTVGTIEKPVLYFHFENFNWFEQFVLQRGLSLTHLFKLREGCGFGGARTSVSNLYPFLAQIGCRWLVADQEIHINRHIMERYLNQYASDGPKPFTIERKGGIGRLSDMDVKAFSIHPDDGDRRWLDTALEQITRGSPWAWSDDRASSGRRRRKLRQSTPPS